MFAVWHFTLNILSFLNSQVSASPLSYKCHFCADYHTGITRLLKLFLQNEII